MMLMGRDGVFARRQAQQEADRTQKPVWLCCGTDDVYRTQKHEPPDTRTWAGVTYEKFEPTPPGLLEVDNFKRLLAANQLGVRVYCEHGHRYVQWLRPDQNDLDFDPVDWEAESGGRGVGLPLKVYGSLVDALDEIDKALLALGRTTLLDAFHRGFGDWREAWGLDEGTREMVKKTKAEGT